MNNPPLIKGDQQLHGSGCASKFPLKELKLNHLSKLLFNQSKIFLGTLDFDDVGAYLISNDQLLVQSVDVIASLPVSPYDFGAICAAHCLSDLYSKSVIPITALNILFHSVSPYYPEQIDNILAGITEKLREANTALIGGHTINEELLYCGLIISGIIRKKEIVLMRGAEEGDDLVLTKPLGTGIISLAVHNKILKNFPQKAISTMSALNNVLLNLKDKHHVHSSTDVTGAGLAGSLYNIAVKNSLKIEVKAAEIPFYEEAWVNALNEENGALFNQDYAGKLINFADDINKKIHNLLFDPQTSGGLLLTVSPRNTDQILNEIFSHNRSIEPKLIGKITGHGAPEINII